MKFSLKPVFIGWLTIVAQLPLQLFLTVWAALFFGGLVSTTGFIAQGSRLPYILFGLIPFIGLPLFIYVGKKFNYRQTEYKFFDDRLEFEEGFFSINKKTIRYRDVKEVTLRRGIVQRMYGLGTVYLATLATGTSNSANAFTAFGFGNVSASGVMVRDIPDPEGTYQKIKDLIEPQT